MRFPGEFQRVFFCLALIYSPNLSGTHGLYKGRMAHIRGGSAELISAESLPPTRYVGAGRRGGEAGPSLCGPRSHVGSPGRAVLVPRDLGV